MIKAMEERSDYYLGMHYPNSTLEFQNHIHDLKFIDLHHGGPTFTWTNKRSSDFVSKKLDRFLVKASWIQSFPDFCAEFSPPEFSDYCARCLHYSKSIVEKAGSFKFFNYLTRHKDFLKVVHGTCQSIHPHGTHMCRLCRKLKALKSALKTLNKTSYTNIHVKVVDARDKLFETHITFNSTH